MKHDLPAGSSFCKNNRRHSYICRSEGMSENSLLKYIILMQNTFKAFLDQYCVVMAAACSSSFFSLGRPTHRKHHTFNSSVTPDWQRSGCTPQMADSDHTSLVHTCIQSLYECVSEVYQVPGSSAGWILPFLCNSAFHCSSSCSSSTEPTRVILEDPSHCCFTF